jgi:hypothetical protein
MCGMEDPAGGHAVSRRIGGERFDLVAPAPRASCLAPRASLISISPASR